MNEELESLLENETWEATNADAIKNTTVIGSRWVFKTKINPNGSTRFKARLVIKGYQQVKEIDFSETFAPVSKLATLRTLLAFAGDHDWQIDHLDVVTAFLNPKIDKDDVLMELPEGREVVRLKKALYGLRQAPRLWYEDINNFLLSIGFHPSIADPNLYIQNDLLLLLYVDDMLISYDPISTNKRAKQIKDQLHTKYKMSYLGQVRRFLGLEIERNEKGYHLGQHRYIQDVIQHFQLEDAHPTLTPMDCHVNLEYRTRKRMRPAKIPLYGRIINVRRSGNQTRHRLLRGTPKQIQQGSSNSPHDCSD
jgi:hypothetical protein